MPEQAPVPWLTHLACSRRFRVRTTTSGNLEFSDLLRTTAKVLAAQPFNQIGQPHAQVEMFRLGFVDPALPPALRPVAERPAYAGDPLFWQFPARTEAAAQALHVALPEAPREHDIVHAYLGLPWATWIDLVNHPSSSHQGDKPREVANELFMQRVRLGGLRRALDNFGLQLRVHTVCQHVYWRQWLSEWKALGVTDLWLSHAPDDDGSADGASIKLHPWRLYAVNVEDPERTAGLQIGRDPQGKQLLASFVGAHADHYASDVRLRLRALSDTQGFHISITERWHFEDLVYQHQVAGRPMAAGPVATESVRRYNELLSDSIFALCPAGVGPNTLRLWEALAVGSVPVLLGPTPQLPRGGTLPLIDWDAIVLRVDDSRLPELPAILASVPIEEVRRRQALGMAAFASVQRQRCF